MKEILVSGGVLLALLFFAFGIGYYANENKWPLPPVVKQYIPEAPKSPAPDASRQYQVPNTVSEQEVTTGEYILPFGVDTDAFTQCLEARMIPVHKNRDYRIKEISPLVRIIVSLSREDVVSAAFEDCRIRLSQQ